MSAETHILDASKEPLGRLASKAAVLLMGKHRPSFERHRKEPVRVVVIHAERAVLTGRKWREKRYFRHSGYIGNLKAMSAAELRARDSRELVRRAVRGMLPKNRLRTQLMKNLRIHRGAAVAGQAPQPEIRNPVSYPSTND